MQVNLQVNLQVNFIEIVDWQSRLRQRQWRKPRNRS